MKPSYFHGYLILTLKILAYVPPVPLLYVYICFNIKINVSSKTIGKKHSPRGGPRCILALHILSREHTYQIIALSKMLPSQLLNTSKKQVPKSHLCPVLPPGLHHG